MARFVHPGTENLLSVPLHENYELVGVQAYIRHAARTPVDTLISQNWENKALWSKSIHDDLPWNKTPYKLINAHSKEEMKTSDIGDLVDVVELNGKAISGKVTTKGQEDLYELGQTLRKRYSQSLYGVESLNQNHFYLQVTGLDRSIVSAKCLAAGLKNMKTDDVNDQETLIIHSLKISEEVLLPNFRQNIAKIQENQKGKRIKDEIPEVLEIKKKLRNIFGVDKLQMRKDVAAKFDLFNTNDCPIHFVFDEYASRIYHGFPVPAEFINMLPDIIRYGSDELFFQTMGVSYKSYGVTDMKIMAKQLISLVLNNFKSNLSDTSEKDNVTESKKLKVYIGHDFTILPILMAFNLFDYRWPSYGEHLVLETYRDRNGHLWVQFIYSGQAFQLNCVGADEGTPLVPIEKIIDYLS